MTEENAPLNDDERAELERLRAEKDNPPAEPEKDDAPLPDSHWLHLANGDVITSKGVASHVDGVPVIGSYEIPAEKQEGFQAEPSHRF